MDMKIKSCLGRCWKNRKTLNRFERLKGNAIDKPETVEGGEKEKD